MSRQTELSSSQPKAPAIRGCLNLLRTSLAALLILSASQGAQAAGKWFKEVHDLQALGEDSKRSDLPVMLMFGAEWCEYCQELVEQVFDPMALNGYYDGKVVLMRHVGVDEQERIPGFDGRPIKKSEWAYELDADLTPMVLFFDGEGREVAPRLVGITNIHMFAGLIHRNLNTAYRNMGSDRRIPATPEQYEKQLQKQSQQ